MVICLEWGADLHVAQLMPLPLTVSCFSKNQIGFTFLVPAHLGSPGKGPLNGCVCIIQWQLVTATNSNYFTDTNINKVKTYTPQLLSRFGEDDLYLLKWVSKDYCLTQKQEKYIRNPQNILYT